MKRSACLLSILVAVVMLTTLQPARCSYYYGTPMKFIETEHETFSQKGPDVDFDRFNNVHLVWNSNEFSGLYLIYHRVKLHDGGVLATEPIEMNPDCEISDCGLFKPLISFGAGSLDVGRCVYHQNIGTNLIQYTSLAYTANTFNWTFEEGVYSTMGASDYKIALYDDYAFLVCVFENKIRVIPGLNDTWSQTLFYDFEPSADTTQANPDICTDDAGYVYVSFEIYNTIGSSYTHNVARSATPLSITSFNDIRLVPGTNDWEQPVIAASGSLAESDLIVCLISTQHSGSDTALVCTVEENGPWSSSIDFGDSSWGITSATAPPFVGNPDVKFGRDNSLHVVWESDASLQTEVYVSTSLNSGAAFSTPFCVSCGTESHTQALNPRIAVSKDASREIAIVYEQVDINGFFHPWLVHIPTYFLDSCDAGFGNWTTVSGVTLDSLTGHHAPGCFRFDSTGARGTLAVDYGNQELTGTIDFWFMDSLSETSGFTMRIEGDDGSKAGVYRMIGINNASSHTAYSVHDGTSWMALSQTRIAGWHHVIVQVSGGGIEMRLDPELTTGTVHQSAGFVNFNRIEFLGGSETDPYYLDDVILAAPVEEPVVPAESLPAILLLLFMVSLALVFRFLPVRLG